MNAPSFSDEILFASLFDSPSIYMWIKDTNNNFIKVNKQAAALEGRSREEMEGKSCFELYPKEMADRFWLEDQEVIRTGLPKNTYHEIIIDTNYLGEQSYRVVKLPIKSENNEVTGVLIYSADISEQKKSEQSFQRKLEEFQLVFENSSDALLWADINTGILVNCNHQAELMLEMDRSQIIGMHQSKIHPKDKIDEYMLKFQENIKNNNSQGIHAEVLSSSGRNIHVMITTTLFDLGNRKIVQGSFHDISERIKFEEELKKSEEKNKALINAIPDLMFVFNSKGICVEYYEALNTDLFTPPESFLNKNILEFLPEEVSRIALGAIEECLSAGKLQQFEYYLNIGQEKKSYDARIVKLNKDRVFALIRDITERKKVESDLKESRKMMQLVLNAIPVRVFWKDSNSVYLGSNYLHAQDNGFNDSADMIGKTDLQIGFSKEEAISFVTDDRQVMESGLPKLHYEEKLTTPNGISWLSTSKVPLYNENNEVVGVLGTYEDITERKLAEKALRESEAKYRLMAENMKDVIWQMSPEMIFTYISPSYELLTGYKPEEVIGKSIWSVITEESAKALRKLLEKRQEGKLSSKQLTSLSFETSQITKKGKMIWIEIVSNPIFDDQGKMVYFQGVSRDITQRKIAEEALKESEERLRAVVSNTPLVLFQVDENLVFRISEGKGLEKLGLKPGQVVGMSVKDVYNDYPQVINNVKSALNGSIEKGVLCVNDLVFETQYRPVRDANGTITSIIGTALDVTEQKNAENALLESEKRFRTLFEVMSEGVALHNLVYDDSAQPVNYRILEVNPSFAKQTGLNQEDIRNKLATELYNTDLPPFLEEYSKVALSGEAFSYETYFELLDRYLKISVVSPEKGRFATVFEDISSQKRREKELRDKNAELESFTYTVSHDLKSPLVTIKGFIGMLEQDLAQANKENIKDDIQRIKLATDKMTSLLNDLLELSRIGRVINKTEKTSMLDIINEACELLSGIISRRGVEMKIAKSFPDVFVDRQRIREVWQNLIENAIKFMGDQQTPVIYFNSLKEEDKYIFNITDNGAGIEKQYQSTIFGLFNKLDNKTEGTGIGLALVKRIVEVHGGEVWVESKGKGMGTTISFSIPVKLFKS